MKTIFPTNNHTDDFFEKTVNEVFDGKSHPTVDEEIRDRGDHYIIKVAVPGFNKKDLNLYLDGDDMLTVAAKQKKASSTFRSEEKFQRRFILPEEVDPDQIKASCRDGLLTIKITKKMANRRKVSIEGESKASVEQKRNVVTTFFEDVWRRLKSSLK